ncbi:MAG: hypothetical protein O2909_07080 [Chloroflexi bacterium]|nr:hypothetical protein [Chloroflexota bacterium]MDA1219187.1 hypothetical protein [Chloroflexota bacterium]
MVEGGIYPFLIPFGRTVAGFCVGVVLGIFGGWMAITFNHMIGFPWSLEVHRNIYIFGIGMGGGLGAYFGWMNFGVKWYLIAGTILLVLTGGVVGAYLGLEYGQVVEPNYLGRRYTIDNMMHWGAAIGGITVATALGMFNYMKNLGR